MNKYLLLLIIALTASCSSEAATTFRWTNPAPLDGATFVSTNVYCDVDNAGSALIASVPFPTAFIEYASTTLPVTGTHNLICHLTLGGFDDFDQAQTLLESAASNSISFNVVNGNLPNVILFPPTNFILTR